MTFCYAKQYKGVIESRCGLLYLPLSPIYGLGGVAVSVFLLPYVDNPLALFFLGMAVCTVLEYVGQLRDGEALRLGVLGLQREAAQPAGPDLPAVLDLLGLPGRCC